eukprot:11215424-Lingulodinium_polyedra.AAC.1
MAHPHMLLCDVGQPTVTSLEVAKRPLTQSQVPATVLKNWRPQACGGNRAVDMKTASAVPQCQERAVGPAVV